VAIEIKSVIQVKEEAKFTEMNEGALQVRVSEVEVGSWRGLTIYKAK